MRSLSVGGVRLEVSSRAGMTLGPAFSSYAPFTDRSARDDDLVIDVELVALTTLPPRPEAEPLYEVEGSWCLDVHAEGYRFYMGRRDPLWVADVDPTFSRVALAPGPALPASAHAGLANILQYPLDQLLIMHRLAAGRGLLVHAAGVTIGKAAVLFPGVSGAGKSTLANKLAPADDMLILCGDRAVLREQDGGFRAFGTPWPGDDGFARNDSATLAALMFVARGEGATLDPIAPREALARLLPVVSIPWFERAKADALLALCERLLAAAPCFVLRHSLGAEVADIVRDAI